MQCLVCEDGESIIMSEDSIPCKCGDIIIIEYHLCEECGAIWKMANGELIEDSLLSAENMDDMLTDMGSFIEKNFNDDANFTTLGGYIHKCLDCGIIAYEMDEGVYKCPGCGFEWEVIDCG